MNARTSPKPWPAELDPRFSAPFRELEAACAAGKMTAWSIASPAGALSVFHADELRARGKRLCPSLHPEFDLASLTKPLFLNWLLRRRWSAHTIARMPISVLMAGAGPVAPPFQLAWEELRSAFRGRGSALTLLDLLDHAAGLRPWIYLGRRQSFVPPQWLGELAVQMCSTLREARGAQEYSDLSYFLLARLFEGLPGSSEGVPGVPWDWASTLASLNLGLGTRYAHASITPDCGANAVPYYPYRSLEAAEELRGGTGADFGPVHDTNASILAGHSRAFPIVSGHAGFFGNVVDVSLSVRSLMESQCGLAELWDAPAPGQRFQVGLDTPSSEASLAGLEAWPLPAGQRIFGHLGYTGTSFWFTCEDRKPGAWQVILSNRVSHRVEVGLTSVPRLAVYSAWRDAVPFRGDSRCFLVAEHGLIPIPRDEFVSLVEEHRGLRRLVWDEARIEAPADIAEVRRAVGRALWNAR